MAARGTLRAAVRLGILVRSASGFPEILCHPAPAAAAAGVRGGVGWPKVGISLPLRRARGCGLAVREPVPPPPPPRGGTWGERTLTTLVEVEPGVPGKPEREITC